MPDENKLICIATILSAHGIKGEVKVRSYTDFPEDLAEFSPLVSSDGIREFKLKITGDAGGDVLIVKIEGVNSRNDAELLKSMELYAPRSSFAETGEDEFYYEDLIDLEARSINGKKMGIIVGVYNYGAGDMLEIKMNNSGKNELIAFNLENVPEIDIDAGYVTIHMPEVEFLPNNDN